MALLCCLPGGRTESAEPEPPPPPEPPAMMPSGKWLGDRAQFDPRPYDETLLGDGLLGQFLIVPEPVTRHLLFQASEFRDHRGEVKDPP